MSIREILLIPSEAISKPFLHVTTETKISNSSALPENEKKCKPHSFIWRNRIRQWIFIVVVIFGILSLSFAIIRSWNYIERTSKLKQGQITLPTKED
ncbi:unnamed protein product [Adineta ricciae]|uniref:Uncharacterized protein n=1 Tax=Adineta ricciae TaxID=249248 RepID=A0A815JNK7_ADIRI|nr:unnamed protein product [Adineta ricciae]